MNHDKIQKLYVYQWYYPSSNKYITSASNIKCIFITSIAIHHSKQIVPLHQVMYLLSDIE